MNVTTVKKPIYLCGFMGCGKTTVGRILAKMLGCQFTDLDAFIEKRAGMTIPEIFKTHGEAHFRKLEAEALVSFPQKCAVIATGGGALVSEENGAAVLARGIPILVDTPFALCYVRIQGDKNRPLAAATREELLARYDARRPFYEKHSLGKVSGTGTSIETANEVLALVAALTPNP
ncbi:MAG: shikimate kinase [Oscillospiraceae bacterium]